MHCSAADATGIIIGAIITFHIWLPNGIDLIFEYVMAFIAGLLIFQALFLKSLAGGNYFKAARKTFFAETVSMNFVMVGDDSRDGDLEGEDSGRGRPQGTHYLRRIVARYNHGGFNSVSYKLLARGERAQAWHDVGRIRYDDDAKYARYVRTRAQRAPGLVLEEIRGVSYVALFSPRSRMDNFPNRRT